MTAPTYYWPKFNILRNPGFETGTGTTSDNWTNSTPGRNTGAQRTGSWSETLADGATLYQDILLVESSGRWISEKYPLWFSAWAKAFASDVEHLSFQAFLYDDSGTPVLKYAYDWWSGSWVAATSETTAPFYKHFLTTSYSQLKSPKIRPVGTAGTDVADGWTLRVKFSHDGPGTSSIEIDDTALYEWVGDTRSERLGPYLILWNGRNFPVKYDTRSGTVTELSLPPPYTHTALPTVTGAIGSPGYLDSAKYYGFAYVYLSLATGEESAVPHGIYLNSGFFYDTPGGSNTALDIDWTALSLPNTEGGSTLDTAPPATYKAVDDTHIDKILVFRTVGQDTEESVKTALQVGDVYFVREVSTSASADRHADKDEDLAGIRDTTRVYNLANNIGAPGFGVCYGFRDRLFVGGGRVFEMGKATTVNGSELVTGRDEDGTTPTLWNRSLEGWWFQQSGDSQKYLVERYVYPEDDGSGASEKLLLSQSFEGTGATGAYTVFPPGIIQYSDEGAPWQYSSDNWIALDGAAGEDPVSINHASDFLVVCTRNRTFAGSWRDNPQEVQNMPVVSRDFGSIAQDGMASVYEWVYWLSDKGVVRWTPGGRVEWQFSAPIQDIFTDPDDDDYVARRPESQLAEEVRVVHFEPDQQVLFAYRSKSGALGCDRVLCYNYFYDSWDIYRLSTELQSWSEIVDDDGNKVLLFTDTVGGVWQWHTGNTDGAGEPNRNGTLVGRATGGSTTTLDDTNALFYTGTSSKAFGGAGTLNMEGVSVKMHTGANAGERRTIYGNSKTQLRFAQAWDNAIASGDIYELGGIDCIWNLKWSNLGLPSRVKRIKFVMVDHKKEALNGDVRVRIFTDFASESWTELRGGKPKRFQTGSPGRSKVGADDAAGYTVRLQLDASGPNIPLEINELSVVYETGEMD